MTKRTNRIKDVIRSCNWDIKDVIRSCNWEKDVPYNDQENKKKEKISKM